MSWISLPTEVEDDAGSSLRSRWIVAASSRSDAFAEVEVIVVGVLGDGPAVEHLVHDQEAHAVGEVEELGRWWVVGGTDGVDAEGAECGETTLPGGERDGGAECASISVEGDAVDFVVDSVEEEPLVGIEVELADAEGDGFVVDGFVVLHQGGVDAVRYAVFQVQRSS